jgi:hypothetical protein
LDNEFNPLGERIAVLETKMEQYELDVKNINEKLDELLELKHKSAGALGLISLIIGSGVIGLITLITQYFNRPHL